MTDAILEATDVVSGYGDAEILHGVDLSVYDEEIVCIVGPNGAGKSTVLKTIFSIIDTWEGTITFNGEDITETHPKELTKMGMCYVPQRNNIFPNLTVEENLRMGAFILDEFPEGRLEEVFELFPILDERRDQRAGLMSGGQQQMVATARALIVDPSLLIIDEPSAGMAPDLVDDTFSKVVEVNDTGTAILMVEQNARKALQIADRGYVLETGRNRITQDADDLLENEEFVRLFLGGGVEA